MPSKKERKIIKRAAKKHKIPVRKLYGVWGTESGFGSNMGPSAAGAYGHFQFMPATGAAYGLHSDKEKANLRKSANAAAKYLSDSGLRKGGKGWAQAQAAYYGAPSSTYKATVARYAKQWEPPGGGRKGGEKGDKKRRRRKTKLVEGKRSKFEVTKPGLKRIPGQSFEAERRQLLRNYVLGGARDDPDSRLQLALSMRQHVDIPSRLEHTSKRVTKKGPRKLKAKQVKAKGGGKGKGKKGELRSGGGWQRSEGMAKYATRVAKRKGIPVTSRKRSSTLGNPDSDHFVGNKDAYAVDLGVAGSAGTRLAKRIAKRYGIKNYKPGNYDGYYVKDNRGRKFRIQILWQVSGHYDHVHVGIRRA